jgi:methionyl-tRNA formyltransferase
MRTIFFGSPDFAVPIFRRLAESSTVVGVVTQPDRRAGRGRKITPPPIAEMAKAMDVPIFQPLKINSSDSLQQLELWAPDAIVVAAYGQILSPRVLGVPPLGCLNVHASLLPRWRGASPIQAAIRAGDAETGVTIMKMDEGMDTGPILSQRRTPIQPHETGGELANRLACMGANLLVETLDPYADGSINPIPQLDDLATYAPLLHKADGLLDWSLPALELQRQIQAFEPWPTSFFYWREKRIVVRRARAEMRQTASPGHVVVLDDCPAIGTSDGLLFLELIQPAGRAEMPAAAFLRGAPAFAGADLSGRA